MRTTLSIESDVAEAVERFRDRCNLSLKEAINQLLRAGLETVEKRASARPFEGRVFQSELMPGIDPNRMNQLNDH